MKKVISLLLVLALCLGMLPAAVFAEENADEAKTIDYLAIGDSTSHGYLFPNYEDGGVVSEHDTWSALQLHGKDLAAYPYFFRDYLNKNVKPVDKFYQYTVQGMRPNELYAVLNPEVELESDKTNKTPSENAEYLGAMDIYCESRVRSYRHDFARFDEVDFNGPVYNTETNTDSILNREQLAAKFTEAIKDADVITYDLGMNNFGNYLSDRLMKGILGRAPCYKNDKFDPKVVNELPEGAKKVFTMLSGKLDELLADVIGEDELINGLKDALLYCFGTFALYFERTIAQIYKLNPNADLIVVDTYNMAHGVSVDLGGTEVDFGTIFQTVYNAMGVYVTTICKNASKYKYASLDNGCEMFIEEVASYVNEAGVPDLDALKNGDEYEKKLFQILVQGAAELMYSSEDLVKLVNGLVGYGLVTGIDVDAKPDKYDDERVDALIDVYNGEFDAYIKNEAELFRAVADKLIALFILAAGDIKGLPLMDIMGTLQGGPEAAVGNLIMGALTTDSPEALKEFYDSQKADVRGIMHIEVRFLLMRGFGTHPSREGQLQKYNAVVKAYNSEISANGTALIKVAVSGAFGLIAFLRYLFNPHGEFNLLTGLGKALMAILGVAW